MQYDISARRVFLPGLRYGFSYYDVSQAIKRKDKTVRSDISCKPELITALNAKQSRCELADDVAWLLPGCLALILETTFCLL